MAESIGLSFFPSADEMASRPGDLNPLQRAVQILSLRLPRINPTAPVPAALLASPGSRGPLGLGQVGVGPSERVPVSALTASPFLEALVDLILRRHGLVTGAPTTSSGVPGPPPGPILPSFSFLTGAPPLPEGPPNGSFAGPPAPGPPEPVRRQKFEPSRIPGPLPGPTLPSFSFLTPFSNF